MLDSSSGSSSSAPRAAPTTEGGGGSRWTTGLAIVVALGIVMWIAVQRIGLAPADVLLVYAVGGYALQQRRWDRDRGVLLGESGENEPPMKWGKFVCEHHQLLSCVVKGHGRSRQENFLAVATSTLAMLYWKAVFRQKLRMGSLQVAAADRLPCEPTFRAQSFFC